MHPWSRTPGAAYRDIGANWLEAQWWGYGLYVFWFWSSSLLNSGELQETCIGPVPIKTMPHEVVDRIQREWGGLDVLVNNVGGTETKAGGFEVLSDEDWQKILEVNLLAAVRLDRAFLPGMIERKAGVVIHISSVAHRTVPQFNSRLRGGQGSAYYLQQGAG
jgi:hypothetical protein